MTPDRFTNDQPKPAEAPSSELAIEAPRDPLVLTPELEAQFIEQENRVVRVIQNYFDRKRWPIDDPRCQAPRNAVIWCVLTPGTAEVAAGDLVAIATLVVLV